MCFRPSITRISGDAKDHKKELWNSQDSLKAVSLPETIQEKTVPESPTIIHPKNEKGNFQNSKSEKTYFRKNIRPQQVPILLANIEYNNCNICVVMILANA